MEGALAVEEVAVEADVVFLAADGFRAGDARAALRVGGAWDRAGAPASLAHASASSGDVQKVPIAPARRLSRAWLMHPRRMVSPARWR
jgi:hypothetical protein